MVLVALTMRPPRSTNAAAYRGSSQSEKMNAWLSMFASSTT